MTSQIRRAVVSIPANIAEGCGKTGDAEFCRYLQIAMGSASELEYFLVLVGDLKLLNSDDQNEMLREVTEIKRMLGTLIVKLKK